MPIHLAHLRWSSLTAQQLDALHTMVRDELEQPGCWSFNPRPDGDSLRATAVWDEEASMQAFMTGRLRSTTESAGLCEPTLVLFAVSDLFAAGYRPRTVTLPAPRSTDEHSDALVDA